MFPAFSNGGSVLMKKKLKCHENGILSKPINCRSHFVGGSIGIRDVQPVCSEFQTHSRFSTPTEVQEEEEEEEEEKRHHRVIKISQS